MALRDEIKEQTVKLKDMTVKEKLAYIWTYYKWYFIIATAVIICIVSVIKTVIINSRPTYLHVEFVNCNVAFDETPDIYDDFVNEYSIDTNSTPLFIGYGNTIYEEGDQASYASQVKLIAQYNAEDLDVVCGPESLLSGRLNVGAYSNLEELLPTDLIKELKDKGYEFYTYTGFPEEEEGIDANTETTPIEPYIGGIYIDKCAYLDKCAVRPIYTVKDGDRPILTVAPNTKNPEHAVEFIRMLIK